jgi:hypothetical protein
MRANYSCRGFAVNLKQAFFFFSAVRVLGCRSVHHRGQSLSSLRCYHIDVSIKVDCCVRCVCLPPPPLVVCPTLSHTLPPLDYKKRSLLETHYTRERTPKWNTRPFHTLFVETVADDVCLPFVHIVLHRVNRVIITHSNWHFWLVDGEMMILTTLLDSEWKEYFNFQDFHLLL